MNPKIKIILTNGSAMNAELYPEIAPNTVANFVELCQAKFFDGLCFHRVIPNFMIQGGGFAHKNELVQKPLGYTISGEFMSNGFTQNKLSHTAGVLSMARTNVKDSASSQFFICVVDVPHLNREYAAFGKLTDDQSLRVAVSISKVPTASLGYYDDVPRTPVVIKTIEVDTMGMEYSAVKIK